LLIEGAPSGAEVRLDGSFLGTTRDDGTFTLTASPGEHSVVIAKEGFLPEESKQGFSYGAKLHLRMSPKPDVELQRWQTLTHNPTLTTLDNFIREYPNGRFAAKARKVAEELEWNSVTKSKDLVALNSFVSKFPQGQYATQAQKLINDLQEEQEQWVVARDSKDIAQLTGYLNKYPDGQYVRVAQAEITRLNDDLKIRETLQKYEDAYNQKNIEGLIALWPAFPTAMQKRTREQFKNAQSVKLNLRIVGAPQILGEKAVVACDRIRDIVNADRTTVHLEGKITFRLTRQNAAWVIEAGAP
jgi:PEGA domain